MSTNRPDNSDSHPTNIISQSMMPENISSIYLCGACHTPVNWTDKGVLCEDCSTWYHINCEDINSIDYSRLDNSSVVWVCTNCDSHNYGKVIYPTYHPQQLDDEQPDCKNDTSYESIRSLEEDVLPKYVSSPKVKTIPRQKGQPLRLINVNCRSIS